MATFKDFRNDVKPNWCPGCGDFSIQAAIQRAVANVGLEPEELALISGIGCSGRISGYINTYGFHGVHGRSLPIAQGVKMANRELTVIASGGDGDGFAIGMGHTIHAFKRNVDMTYIVMDNQIYGLTKGQTSPTSAPGFKTKSTPKGSIEKSVSPVELALTAGATFVAQSFSNDLKGLTQLIEQATAHKGFAHQRLQSMCHVQQGQYVRLVQTELDEAVRHRRIRSVELGSCETDRSCSRRTRHGIDLSG